MYLIDLTSTDNGVRALKDSRAVVAESTLDPRPLAFSQFFIFSEQVRMYVFGSGEIFMFSQFVPETDPKSFFALDLTHSMHLDLNELQ